MPEKISLKYIFKLLLNDRKSLILGQILTIIGILISVPIPLLLPLLVDEVLLNKPNFFVNNINELFGAGSPLYYIVLVTIVVIFLRFIKACPLWMEEKYIDKKKSKNIEIYK